MRVGYVSSVDPLQPWAWSGSHRFMFQALQRAGFDVVHVGRSFVPRNVLLRKVIGRIRKLRPGGPMHQDELRAGDWQKSFERDVRESACDVLFGPAASRELALVDPELPYVYLSDATSLALRATNADYRSQPEQTLESLHRFEAQAMSRATRLVYASRWAADSAIADYGAPPERVRVIEFGANLAAAPAREQALARRRDAVCRLLFVGRQWEAKGGPAAHEALLELNKRGIDAELTVCGADVPSAYLHPRLRGLGLLDKSVPAQNEALLAAFREAHFFILPTRYECFGVAFCEANAFGLPVFGPATGGVPTIIEQGRNGFLLPYDASGAEYADAIAKAWESDAQYGSLVEGARDAFERRLNWDVWARRVGAELIGASAARSHPPTPT